MKIPLLQALRDILIYSKTVKELCLKKPRRKKKEPPTIHFIGKVVELMFGKISIDKYEDLGNLVVSIHVRGFLIPNTLIDLGVLINIMTLNTMQQLGILDLCPTPIVLELADRSKIKPEEVLDDEIVSLNSWEYPVDFFVLQPTSTSEIHLVILGRPWLSTMDSFIGCGSENMFISWNDSVKQVTLYLPSKSISKLQNFLWFDDEASDKYISQLVFSIDQVMSFKESSK